MDDTYRSQFRLPYPLYELLKKAADTNHRSVNAELVARLEASFPELTMATFVDLYAHFKETAAQMPFGSIASEEMVADFARRMVNEAIKHGGKDDDPPPSNNLALSPKKPRRKLGI